MAGGNRPVKAKPWLWVAALLNDALGLLVSPGWLASSTTRVCAFTKEQIISFSPGHASQGSQQ